MGLQPGNRRSRAVDVLVIGAGPAGCAAAISARMAGLTVAMLEVRAACNSPLPGETLHPGLEPIFRKLGVWDTLLDCGFHRHRGIWRERQDGLRGFEPYGHDQNGSWLGFQVDRARLHELLRNRVRDLDGKLSPVMSVDGLLTGEARVAGVRADGCVYGSRFVLDGTGRHAWLARQLQLEVERSGPEQRLQFGWVDDAAEDLDGQPLFRQRTDGWDWLAPVGAGRCAWARLRAASEGSGVDYTWRIFRESAGRGYCLLGDAACLMDPSAANGVLRAMMSGIYAVHLIGAVLKGSIVEDVAITEYRKWVSQMFDSTRAQLREAGLGMARSGK